MAKLRLIAPTLFGIESITARELKKLGYTDVVIENGRVRFVGDQEAICRANIWLRTAERVLVQIGEFRATTFDELFEKTKALPWGDFLPENAEFPVSGYSLKSKLFSVSDCQAIVKKAIVEKLKMKYNRSWFEESGPLYQIQFSIIKDKVTLMIDTSGQGLHKRGYRRISNEAPLRETLGAALVMLSDYRYDRPLWDPFCGSGTIPIEGALIGANIAPGMNRDFCAESWPNLSEKLWVKAREEAYDLMKKDIKLNIKGSDIDENVINLSKANAKKAGVEDCIQFFSASFDEVEVKDKYGCLICNPPYGERMGEPELVEYIYKKMGKIFNSLDTWSFYVITSHQEFEKLFGKKANKNRKLYNGMMKCYYYQYFGPRPPR
jgi:putative N6-adenine-specific DNA methylase